MTTATTRKWQVNFNDLPHSTIAIYAYIAFAVLSFSSAIAAMLGGQHFLAGAWLSVLVVFVGAIDLLGTVKHKHSYLDLDWDLPAIVALAPAVVAAMLLASELSFRACRVGTGLLQFQTAFALGFTFLAARRMSRGAWKFIFYGAVFAGLLALWDTSAQRIRILQDQGCLTHSSPAAARSQSIDL